MKKYQITFLSGDIREMLCFSDDIDPLDEVAKWQDSEHSVQSVVSVVDITNPS